MQLRRFQQDKTRRDHPFFLLPSAISLPSLSLGLSGSCVKRRNKPAHEDLRGPGIAPNTADERRGKEREGKGRDLVCILLQLDSE